MQGISRRLAATSVAAAAVIGFGAGAWGFLIAGGPTAPPEDRNHFERASAAAKIDAIGVDGAARAASEPPVAAVESLKPTPFAEAPLDASEPTGESGWLDVPRRLTVTVRYADGTPAAARWVAPNPEPWRKPLRDWMLPSEDFGRPLDANGTGVIDVKWAGDLHLIGAPAPGFPAFVTSVAEVVGETATCTAPFTTTVVRCTWKNGRPVAGVRVRAWDDTAGSEIFVEGDDAGVATLRGFAGPSLHCEAFERDGDHWLPLRPDPEEPSDAAYGAWRRTIPAGSAAVVVLTRSLRVQGRVVDGDGTPVAGVLVRLLVAIDGRPPIGEPPEAITDARGCYRFDRPLDGRELPFDAAVARLTVEAEPAHEARLRVEIPGPSHDDVVIPDVVVPTRRWLLLRAVDEWGALLEGVSMRSIDAPAADEAGSLGRDRPRRWMAGDDGAFLCRADLPIRVHAPGRCSLNVLAGVGGPLAAPPRRDVVVPRCATLVVRGSGEHCLVRLTPASPAASSTVDGVASVRFVPDETALVSGDWSHVFGTLPPGATYALTTSYYVGLTEGGDWSEPRRMPARAEPLEIPPLAPDETREVTAPSPPALFPLTVRVLDAEGAPVKPAWIEVVQDATLSGWAPEGTAVALCRAGEAQVEGMFGRGRARATVQVSAPAAEVTLRLPAQRWATLVQPMPADRSGGVWFDAWVGDSLKHEPRVEFHGDRYEVSVATYVDDTVVIDAHAFGGKRRYVLPPGVERLTADLPPLGALGIKVGTTTVGRNLRWTVTPAGTAVPVHRHSWFQASGTSTSFQSLPLLPGAYDVACDVGFDDAFRSSAPFGPPRRVEIVAGATLVLEY